MTGPTTSNTGATALGIGEVILDHVWEHTNSGGQLVGTRGGGSVFNILANLSSAGWQTQVAGVSGDDIAGGFALQDLAGLGVDTRQVQAQPRRHTRLIFELLGSRATHQVSGVKHAFTTQCPVCRQRIETSQRPTLRAISAAPPEAANWMVYDQLTRARVGHALSARRAGTGTVLDLGAVSYLRYQPTARVIADLRNFTVAFVNKSVAKSLVNRTGVADTAALATLLPDTVLVVTQGRAGALVLDGTGQSVTAPAPELDPVVDDAGAGDALCASTLDLLTTDELIGRFARRLGDDVLSRSTPTVLSAKLVGEAVAHAQDRVIPTLRAVGARGHLAPSPTSPYEPLRGLDLQTLQHMAAADGRCPLCALPVAGVSPRADPYLEEPERIQPPDGAVVVDLANISRPVVDSATPGMRGDIGRLGGDDTRDDTEAGTDARRHDAGGEAARTTEANTARSVSRRATSRPGAKRNTALMLNRVLIAAEQFHATKSAADLLNRPGTARVIGSGGSLPAATYISDVLNRAGHFAVAQHPGEYVSGPGHADLVVAVTYSGGTRDMELAMQHAIRSEAGRMVLVTGAERPTLGRLLRPIKDDVVVSYTRPTRSSGALMGGRSVRERGFVSIAGTVMPCVPWLTAASGIAPVVDMVERLVATEPRVINAATRLASRARQAARLHVVYGPGAKPAALDIESKFTESGLPAVTLHEQKDLSHGRFMSVLQPPAYKTAPGVPPPVSAPVLFLSAGLLTRYQTMLVRTLEETTFVETLNTETDDLVAPLELLTLVQVFSQVFGSELGVDISRPETIPQQGLRLYKWRGPLP